MSCRGARSWAWQLRQRNETVVVMDSPPLRRNDRRDAGPTSSAGSTFRPKVGANQAQANPRRGGVQRIRSNWDNVPPLLRIKMTPHGGMKRHERHFAPHKGGRGDT